MEPDHAETWVLCHVSRAELCYLRYTLEAYEGLCVPTTLPGGEGRVLLMSCPERRNELEAVLVALADEVQLVVERWGEEPHGAPCPWTP